MKIIYTKKFVKELKKCDSNIKEAFKERLRLFLKDKNNQLLNNHALKGELKLYRSINVSGDWRAIFRELEDGRVVFFVMFGKNSKLYK